MKQVFFLIIVLLTSFTTTAQTSSDKYTGALLWKVSGNGLQKPSYVVGTNHLAPTNFIDSIAGLHQAMDNVDQIAGELLIDDMTSMQTKIMQAGIMPSDQSYKALLKEEEYNRLDEGLTEILGIGLDKVGYLKPGMIISLCTIALYTQINPEFNLMPRENIDLYIQKYGTENNKSVIGLETVEDQIYALFDYEPLKDQIKNFTCALNNIDFLKNSLSNLDKYYTEKKLTDMYNLAFNDSSDPCPASEAAKLALNKNRNDKWIAKLPAIFNQKSTLVAVGALHLAGEEGILNQLAQLGYAVEAVK